ncbi:MAG: hypothetical protein HYS17_02960 [Micavibrio aeruginosavorus]|uniref:Acyltransferase 3 domain-containing protein n=1 Tax=Micavibrio aeruginosavorus TaxID=349221 RepID=A0A7T5R3D2_9BACT|nr:MAG: hypothetical protein HYS17_02960 [Micavibrio aeruginosavorus]
MTQPADKYPFPGQILPLTAVRFWAASWVMIFHFSTMLPDGSIKDWPWVLRGYLGVDFFFILSGFVSDPIFYLTIQTNGRYMDCAEFRCDYLFCRRYGAALQ